MSSGINGKLSPCRVSVKVFKVLSKSINLPGRLFSVGFENGGEINAMSSSIYEGSLSVDRSSVCSAVSDVSLSIDRSSVGSAVYGVSL